MVMLFYPVGLKIIEIPRHKFPDLKIQAKDLSTGKLLYTPVIFKLLETLEVFWAF